MSELSCVTTKCTPHLICQRSLMTRRCIRPRLPTLRYNRVGPRGDRIGKWRSRKTDVSPLSPIEVLRASCVLTNRINFLASATAPGAHLSAAVASRSTASSNSSTVRSAPNWPKSTRITPNPAHFARFRAKNAEARCNRVGAGVSTFGPENQGFRKRRQRSGRRRWPQMAADGTGFRAPSSSPLTRHGPGRPVAADHGTTAL